MQSDNNNGLDPKTTTTTASASILGENNNDTNNNDHQQVMQLSNTADTQDMDVSTDSPVPNDNTNGESSPQPVIDPESEQQVNNAMVEGLCIDCKDQEASVYCENCSEDFCEMCYAMLHRTGNRRNHKTKSLKHLNNNGPENNLQQQSHQNANLSDDKDGGLKATSTIISSGGSTFGQWLEERSKYIPIRLTLSERKFLRLLEAALNVSEYTDKIDIISYNSSKSRRILHQIKDLCAILSGLMVASDFKKGQELFANKSFEDNEEFFQKIFEIGRRHKVMNPEKMRDAYGKLMYLLMDSVIPEVQEMLSFSLISPIKTVFSFLKDRDALKVLHHDLVVDATKEIIPDGKTRYTINSEIKKKERAIEFLSAKFSNKNISSDEIKQCLYSIGDNHSYLRSNRDCCDRMLHYLTTYFHPEKIATGFSLAIQSGRHGARLSHNHETQYCYAKQTLSLWSEIQYEMFKLWTLADRDLLSENNTYRLRDTGQGLNRLQSCPSVSRTMHSILHLAQQKSGYWVGSSVIHLGDKNVPNALMFIDKYNQISRILTPILICLDSISTLVQKNTGIRAYIQNSFSDVENCKKTILADFFRYAFDGSGADNFFDAGSCIDGRLTSAWNWCSQIEKKTYFPVFLLTGFVGFDGENF
nr:14730_t:CDS:10 [Entrophospora candida]CAG8469270.1 10638_t:CDS:10 [Entrophospora candida]